MNKKEQILIEIRKVCEIDNWRCDCGTRYSEIIHLEDLLKVISQKTKLFTANSPFLKCEINKYGELFLPTDNTAIGYNLLKPLEQNLDNKELCDFLYDLIIT